MAAKKSAPPAPSPVLTRSLEALRAQGVPFRKLADLRRREGNPRDNAEAVPAIVRSLQTFGWTTPMLVDPRGELEAGDTRYLAALHLGLDEVPVIATEHDERTAKLYVPADNRLGELAQWNPFKLADLFKDFTAPEIRVTGWEPADVQALLPKPPSPLRPDMPDNVDEALEASSVPKRVVLGDVWACGRHRVICGDCTTTTPIDDDACALLFTDPPYGVSYQSRGGGGGRGTPKHARIQNDSLTAEQLSDFLDRSFAGAVRWLRPGAAAYVFHADQRKGIRPIFEACFERAGFDLMGTLIWVKNVGSMGWQDYRAQHEPILYGALRGADHRRVEDRTQTTVWDERRDAASNYLHPTQKPVGLAIRAIRNSTAIGERVLDVFGGSGSTMIAAEIVRRRAVLVELEPRYCDVAIERWTLLTGHVPEKVGSVLP